MVRPNRGRFQVKRFLLDSNAVNDLMRRQVNVLANYTHARRGGFRVGTCEPIVAEILAGLEMSSTRAANVDRFHRTLSEIACWPLDRAASQAFGKIAAELRRLGRPMQTIDIMLAAIAVSLGDCSVVTCDSDLLAMPGLTVVNWQNEPGLANG